MESTMHEELVELQKHLRDLAAGYEERYGRDEVHNSLTNTVYYIQKSLDNGIHLHPPL
jgi:hypothetical protein